MSSPRRSGGSSVSGRSGSSTNLNSQYRALMRSAHEENRNGNPYNDKYTFTVQGKRKVSSKARKFIKTALLLGGTAALGYYFKGPIGRDLTKLLTTLKTKYPLPSLPPAMTTLHGQISSFPATIRKSTRSKYSTAKKGVRNWYESARLHEYLHRNSPGWQNRAMQGLISTQRGVQRAKNAARTQTLALLKRAQNRLSKK